MICKFTRYKLRQSSVLKHEGTQPVHEIGATGSTLVLLYRKEGGINLRPTRYPVHHQAMLVSRESLDARRTVKIDFNYWRTLSGQLVIISAPVTEQQKDMVTLWSLADSKGASSRDPEPEVIRTMETHGGDSQSHHSHIEDTNFALSESHTLALLWDSPGQAKVTLLESGPGARIIWQKQLRCKGDGRVYLSRTYACVYLQNHNVRRIESTTD